MSLKIQNETKSLLYIEFTEYIQVYYPLYTACRLQTNSRVRATLLQDRELGAGSGDVRRVQ